MSKKSAMQRVTYDTGMSLGALAVHLGVGRERMYDMLKKGKLRTVHTSAGQVVPPDECERLKTCMTTVIIPSGRKRTVFEEV